MNGSMAPDVMKLRASSPADGLKIVEGLLNTVYVSPKHADRLRKSRGLRKWLN